MSDVLGQLISAIRSGSISATDQERHAYVQALEAAMTDTSRIDFMQEHGVDWDGMSGYFHRAGTHDGESLRACVDKAKKAMES